jgi:hypothetical protein
LKQAVGIDAQHGDGITVPDAAVDQYAGDPANAIQGVFPRSLTPPVPGGRTPTIDERRALECFGE